MNVLVQLADAIADSLNAGSFSQAFTAERLYQPVFDLPDLAGLRVSVVPRSVEITSTTRAKSFFDCTVDIGLQLKIDDDIGIDDLLTLAQEIIDALRGVRPPTMSEAIPLSISHDPVVASEHLEQQRVVTSVISLTYRVMR